MKWDYFKQQQQKKKRFLIILSLLPSVYLYTNYIQTLYVRVGVGRSIAPSILRFNTLLTCMKYLKLVFNSKYSHQKSVQKIQNSSISKMHFNFNIISFAFTPTQRGDDLESGKSLVIRNQLSSEEDMTGSEAEASCSALYSNVERG